MTWLLKRLRAHLNRRRIKRIEARKSEWNRLLVAARMAELTNHVKILELMIVAENQMIQQLSEAA